MGKEPISMEELKASIAAIHSQAKKYCSVWAALRSTKTGMRGSMKVIAEECERVLPELRRVDPHWYEPIFRIVRR